MNSIIQTQDPDAHTVRGQLRPDGYGYINASSCLTSSGRQVEKKQNSRRAGAKVNDFNEIEQVGQLREAELIAQGWQYFDSFGQRLLLHPVLSKLAMPNSGTRVTEGIDYTEVGNWKCVTWEEDMFDRYSCGPYILTSDLGAEVGIWWGGSQIALEYSLATARSFVAGHATALSKQM